ncbi:MAG: NAD(P)/FAD-dependent oxidoreductase [Nitrospinales bacterium]
MRQNNRDVIIIGAGVIGQSIAFRLKQLKPSLNITVLGDPMNSLMASKAAAGMLAPYSECEKADQFFSFCRESLAKYPQFIEELTGVSGDHVHLSIAGSVLPASGLGEKWEERLAFFKTHKVPYEVWKTSKVKIKLPYFDPSCGEVIWVAEGQVNNRQLHSALLTATKKLGVEALSQNVTGFIRDANSITAAVTDEGEVAGNNFILASGSWSQQLGKVLDVSIPLKPIKGQMCRVKMDENILDYTVHGHISYIAPWKDGNGYVIGSTMEDRGFNPMVEDEVIQNLIDKAATIIPRIKEASLIEAWTGLRPAAEDLMPIMGASGRYKNLSYSTGHYRNGILQTPNQADYLAQSFLGILKDPIPEFAPSRYGL